MFESPISSGHARRVMTTFFAAVVLFACGMAFLPGAALADEGFGVSVWHRLNTNLPSNPPEHERLTCAHGSVVWLCRYDKVRQTALNFQWNSTTGYFAGRDITASWSCPDWFPSTICANATRVVEGTFLYLPAVAQPFTVLTDLVFTSGRLHVYWVNQFVCPWFPTFAAALAANPFPLPFNGTDWPAQDCINAP